MKNLDFLKNRPIAHRGLFDKENKIPENSMIAFRKAKEEGYPIELDVHLLEDGKVVVFHDDDLFRMTGVKKKIKDCTYNEIRDLNLSETEYKIPLFEEVLELIDGKVPILIEIKTDRKAGETEDKLVKILENYKGDFAVQSFNPLSVKWFKDNFSEIPRGQLASKFKNDKMFFLKKIFMKNLYLNFITKPDFVSYSIGDLPKKQVEKFRNKGNMVLCWTVRNKSDLEKSKKYCDNLIGENLKNLEI